MGAMAPQICSLTIVYSTVYSDEDQRKHQRSASLAFMWEIHRWPVNSPHKGPVTRKMSPFDDVIMKPFTINSVLIHRILSFLERFCSHLFKIKNGSIFNSSHQSNHSHNKVISTNMFLPSKRNRMTPKWAVHRRREVLIWDIHLKHISILHDDVITWKHFPRYWPFVRGIHRPPVNSPNKGQWRGALMFSLTWFETPSNPLWRHCNEISRSLVSA